MAQHDYTIANQGFPATRSDINNALSAIATNNSGTSAPSTQYAGQFWIDTTASTWELYIHDGTDDILFATIDTSANTVNFIDSALDVVTDTTPQLGGDLDLNSNDITGTGDINITGTVTATSFSGDGSSLTGISTDLVGDTTPQLGGMLDVNGQAIGDGTLELVKFAETASAVNEITITNADTTNAPEISATGDDTNIDLRLNTKGTGGVVFNAGAVATPSITTTGDTNTGIFFPSADTIAFTEGGAEAMRILNNGNVAIGRTTANFGGLGADHTVLTIGTTSGMGQLELAGFRSSDADLGRLIFGNKNVRLSEIVAIRTGADNSNALSFSTSSSGSNTERMRIFSDGVVGMGVPSNASNEGNSGTDGINFACTSGSYVQFTKTTGVPLGVNRAGGSNGTVISIRGGGNGGGVERGTISISGDTVSYNAFTGSHWSRFINKSKPDVLVGTVIESLDEMTDWYNVEFETSYTEKDKDGNDILKTTKKTKPYTLKTNEQEGDVITCAWNTEKKDEEGNDIIEQVQATIVKEVDVKHVMSKISDTSEAKNVYGVFSAWDNDDLINNDFYVASVGSYVVRIKAGEVVSKGDLLQSNGDGTAKVQADDLVRASSFAKVLSNTIIDTYEDGSFIVPCSLMC
jgi:hypothetical protein